MNGEVIISRMTLRELLTFSEKCTRELHTMIHDELLRDLADYRELSRPVRRKSHYPKMVAVENAYRKVMQTRSRVQELTNHLEECLNTIREHAKREIVNRL